MFKSSSKNTQKHLKISDNGNNGGGNKGKAKFKTPITTCKKHPKHQQSPGVCAVCLREKLTRIPASSSKITRGNKVASTSSSYLSSLSSQEYSSNASSCSSPVHRSRHQRSYSSMTTFLKRGKKNNEKNDISNTKIVLKKSRSLAFLMQRPEVESVEHHGKKKQGFWSKLLHSRTRNKEDHGTIKSRALQESRRT